MKPRLPGLVGLTALLFACAGSSLRGFPDLDGVRSKGGEEGELTGIEAFADLDWILAQRIDFMESAAQGLRRSLTVYYREQLVEGVIPQLRKLHEVAQKWAAEAAAMAEGPERNTKLQRAGVRYEALWVESDVIQLELAMAQMADEADGAGQASNQIVAQLRACDADFADLLQAAQDLQAERMAEGLQRCAPRFQQWVEFMGRWRRSLERGLEWSRKAQLIADGLMLAGAAYRLRLPRIGNGFPPLGAVGAGGVAAAARISTLQLARTLEAIRQLIAIGALDPQVVMGVAALGGQLAGTVEQPRASAMAMGSEDRRSPHRTPPRLEDGNLKEGWRHIEARHIKGDHPSRGAGSLFAPGTTREQLEQAARTIVEKGLRVTRDPTRLLQTFEMKLAINGRQYVVRLIVDSFDGNRVITMFPRVGGL